MAARCRPLVESQTDASKIFSKQSTHLVARHRASEFFITPLKSFFKKLFIGTNIGEALQKMLSVKSNPEGLMMVECEHGVGGKNAPILYIPEQDPVQDALDKTKNTTHFKLTLPNTGNELKVAIWTSGTPGQFLLHVRTAMHICKQLGLETKEANAMMVLEAAY